MTPDEYARVLTFAARAHADQQTPHGLPYLVHVCLVANEVIAAHGESDRPPWDLDLALRCALLHDVVEDTDAGEADVAAAFGPQVAAGVRALTKDEALPKAERMPDSLRRILEQPPAVAAVKLADRICNLGPPPPHWDTSRMAAYRDEARTILDALGHADRVLAVRLAGRIEAYPP